MIQEMQLDALVKAGIFHSETEAVKEALRVLFMTRPQLNVEAAIQLYRAGEITLGRAAEIAGMTRWEFEDLLADRGIARFMSPEPIEDLERQVDRLQRVA